MKAVLDYAAASLPERLLIDQVPPCWLRLSVMEREQTRALRVSQTYTYLNYLERATTQTQRRHTNAVSSLVRVRRLLRPRGPLSQVNALQWKYLRATFGTRLGEAGLNAFEIADLTGPPNIHTTRRYVRVMKGKKREAVRATMLGQERVIEMPARERKEA